MALAFVLDRSVQVAAEESPAFGHVAERFRRAGELDRAVALCRDGLQRFPSYVSARVTLGWALLDLGHYEEARAELEKVLIRAPDNLAAIRGLAQLHDHAGANEVGDLDGPASWAALRLDELDKGLGLNREEDDEVEAVDQRPDVLVALQLFLRQVNERRLLVEPAT